MNLEKIKRYIDIKKAAYIVLISKCDNIDQIVRNYTKDELKIFDNTIKFPNDLELFDDVYYDSLSFELIDRISKQYNISESLVKDKIKEYIKYPLKDIYEDRIDENFSEFLLLFSKKNDKLIKNK